MHRIVALSPPPQDEAHFRTYYHTVHLPLAAKLPGLRAMHHSFSIQTLTPGKTYFCTWTGEFDDAATAAAALASPEGKAVAADLPNYATGGVRPAAKPAFSTASNKAPPPPLPPHRPQPDRLCRGAASRPA